MSRVYLFLITSVMVFSSQLAFAEETPSNYPGNWTRSDGQTVVGINIALALVQEGVYAYFYSIGEWPESWSAVIDSGICQVPLTSPQGYSIDPDDGSLDFMWDVSYIPTDGYYSPPKTVAIMDIDGPYTSTDPFESIRSLETIVETKDPERAMRYQGLIDNPDWRKLAGIRRLCNKMILRYNMLKHDWPSWEEFHSSMWSPINSASINPLTKQGFRFDGSPNDLQVIYPNPEGMPSVQMTDINGEVTLVIIP